MINFLFLLDKFKIDGYIIPKNDEYFNEYISPSEDRLKFYQISQVQQDLQLYLKIKSIYLLMGDTQFKLKNNQVKNLKLLLYLINFLKMS